MSHNPKSFKAISKLFFLMLSFSIFGIQQLPAQSSIEGKWKESQKGGIIEIYEEDGQYFGQLIGSENQEETEKIQAREEKIIILRNFEKKNDTKFCCGKIFQPKTKRTLNGTLTLVDENTLKVKGKMGIMSGTTTWTRI